MPGTSSCSNATELTEKRGKVMRMAILAVAAGLVWTGAADACEDHVGKCEIEAWRWYSPLPGMLTIEGSATCDSGIASIRLFERDGDEQRFLGVATGIIDGHALQAVATNIDEPQNLTIRISIDTS